MRYLNRRIVKILGVVLVVSIAFVVGGAVGALLITDQHYTWMRGHRAYRAKETITILTKLRDGEIEDLIESLDRAAIFDLWVYC